MSILNSLRLHSHFTSANKTTYKCGPKTDGTDTEKANAKIAADTGDGKCTAMGVKDKPRQCFCAIDNSTSSAGCDPLKAEAASTESGASGMSEAATVLLSIAMFITYRMF